MNDTALLSTGTSDPRLRALIWIGTALGIVVLSASLLWLVAPELGPYAANPNPAPIHHLFGDPGLGRMAAAGLQACVGAAASAVGLAALFGRRGLTAPLSGAAVAAGLLGAVGLVGLGGLATAGYSLAHALPLLLVVLLVLAMRTAVVRTIAALAGLSAIALLVVGPTPFRPLYLQFAEYVVAHPVGFTTPLVLMVFAGVWMLVGTIQLQHAPGALGRFVLRQRIVITVLAACCSLPYIVARLSWLTPWPFFGDPRDYDDVAVALTNGLILGAAMLVGGILTLGLILPWGTRFPRWFGRLAGTPVPVSLAVVPASIVSVLFISAGLDSLLLAGEPGTGIAIPLLMMAVVFPFWLWGPLLALATWGYALYRRVDTDDGTSHVDGTYPTEGSMRKGVRP